MSRSVVAANRSIVVVTDAFPATFNLLCGAAQAIRNGVGANLSLLPCSRRIAA
jgi:hypothetical protein